MTAAAGALRDLAPTGDTMPAAGSNPNPNGNATQGNTTTPADNKTGNKDQTIATAIANEPLAPAPDAPHGFDDWRDNPALPRTGYYSARNTTISMLTIHNTAGTETIQQDNAYHSSSAFYWGAPHIAYHFYLDMDGHIYWCNYLWERSWHACNANDAALGISLRGVLDRDQPTNEQLASLQWLTATYLPRLNVQVPVTGVFGHGELSQYGNNTSCPGRYMWSRVVAYRLGVAFDWALAPRSVSYTATISSGLGVMREGPATGFNTVGNITPGDTLTVDQEVTGQNVNGDTTWVHLQGHDGWITRTALTLPTPILSDPPTVLPGPGTGSSGNGATGSGGLIGRGPAGGPPPEGLDPGIMVNLQGNGGGNGRVTFK